MTPWLCFSTPAMLLSGGLLHQLHWPLLWVAVLLLWFSAVGVVRIDRMRARRRQLRRSSMDSALNSKPSASYGDKRMMSWAETFRTHAALWTGYAARWAKVVLRIGGEKNKGLVRLYTMGWIGFTLLLVVAVSYAFAHPFGYPIEKHHNVYVWSQVKGQPDEWWISSDENVTNKLPFNTWKCCPDFPCSTVIWPGYVAETLKYEERGSCKSIRASGLGIWWKTNEKGDVKEIQ
jgi:hypothetical protein